MKFQMAIAAPAAGVLVAVLAACGGDDAEPGASTTAPSGATQAGGEFFAGVGIEASDFQFTPRDLEVGLRDDQTGVAIAYENVGAAPHTFTLYKDRDYRNAVEGGSTALDGSTTEERIPLDATTGQVERGKTYYFRCEIHPDRMQGVLKIK